MTRKEAIDRLVEAIEERDYGDVLNFDEIGGIINQKYGSQRYGDILQAARKRLIAAGRESMLDIALETGFCSQSHFGKVFKSHTGMTPKEYRRSIIDIY